jgi:hypothetical protein
MKCTYCLSVSRHLVVISDLSELNFLVLADSQCSNNDNFDDDRTAGLRISNRSFD